MHSLLPLTSGEPLAANFHCRERLKEIPVSSLVQFSRIKKKNKPADHDVGRSRLEWMENSEISSHSKGGKGRGDLNMVWTGNVKAVKCERGVLKQHYATAGVL